MTDLPANTGQAGDEALPGYGPLFDGIVNLLEQARLVAARSVNQVMTATYWAVGRRIVEQE